MSLKKTGYQQLRTQRDRIINHDFPWMWAVSSQWSSDSDDTIERFRVLRYPGVDLPSDDEVRYILSERVDAKGDPRKLRVWIHLGRPPAVREIRVGEGLAIAANISSSDDLAHLVVGTKDSWFNPWFTIICVSEKDVFLRLIDELHEEDAIRRRRRLP